MSSGAIFSMIAGVVIGLFLKIIQFGLPVALICFAFFGRENGTRAYIIASISYLVWLYFTLLKPIGFEQFAITALLFLVGVLLSFYFAKKIATRIAMNYPTVNK